MNVPILHRWPRRPATAVALQRRLAGQVRICRLESQPRLLAGADAAFGGDGNTVLAGVVVWDCLTQQTLERIVVQRPCRFPYVPGLLSFRELPGVLAAFRKLRRAPDAVLCDAQGLAHPRRFGLACHLGLWLGLPTIGCAKSRLCGEYQVPPRQRGARTGLWLDGTEVGCVLRTRDDVRPLFVSPGHLCDVESAARLTLAAATRYRLPEPTRLAHLLVNAARRRLATSVHPTADRRWPNV